MSQPLRTTLRHFALLQVRGWGLRPWQVAVAEPLPAPVQPQPEPPSEPEPPPEPLSRPGGQQWQWQPSRLGSWSPLRLPNPVWRLWRLLSVAVMAVT